MSLMTQNFEGNKNKFLPKNCFNLDVIAYKNHAHDSTSHDSLDFFFLDFTNFEFHMIYRP